MLKQVTGIFLERILNTHQLSHGTREHGYTYAYEKSEYGVSGGSLDRYSSAFVNAD